MVMESRIEKITDVAARNGIVAAREGGKLSNIFEENLMNLEEMFLYYIIRDVYYLYEKGEISLNDAEVKKKKALRYVRHSNALEEMQKNSYDKKLGPEQEEPLLYDINKEKDKEKKLELALEFIRKITGQKIIC